MVTSQNTANRTRYFSQQRQRTHLFVFVTFKEAIPYDDRSPNGPFYAPGSKWNLGLLDERLLRHAAFMANYHRAKGLTVTVSIERR